MLSKNTYWSDFSEKGRNKIYDRYTLYIELGDATRSQLDRVLCDALNKIGIKCHYKINMIQNRKKGINLAYVRVTDKTVYNILIGRNPDGSERVLYHDDPTFVPPSEPHEQYVDRMLEGITDWYEMDEIDNEANKLYECPKIKEQLDPLVEIIPYNKNKGFKIEPAYVYTKSDEYYSNIIMAFDVPEWITDKVIRPYFAGYVSISYRYKDASKRNEYPNINFRTNYEGKKSVYIEFHTYSFDCEFAMLMSKILYVVHPQTKRNVRLFFNYLRRKDVKKLSASGSVLYNSPGENNNDSDSDTMYE